MVAIVPMTTEPAMYALGTAATAPTLTLGVRIAYSTRELLRAAASSPKTQTGVILEAIEATLERLAAQFAAAGTGSRLFTAAHTVRKPRHEEAWVQISLRVPRQDKETLDRLVREVQAPDRSALVDTALRLHLTASSRQH
jgi:hypothetical protein